MGKNKQLQRRIAGLLRNISRHQAKIESELRKPSPNAEWIRGWEREIDTTRKNVRRLEDKLER
jgi:hypothetical protein